jgi:uncharacterized NAD(P)/FAD-binding protein YdhS
VEHITNVSDHEIPELVTSMEEWIDTLSSETLRMFNIDPDSFNEHKVVPRLLFGKYLSTQFDLLKKQADQSRIDTQVYLNSTVSDITDRPEEGIVIVTTASNETFIFDAVVICAGHKWPLKYEGNIPGYFDSPYPPAKLMLKLDHPAAIRGSSLTAIDAIRTLARHNGVFETDKTGNLVFQADPETPDFKIVMHSRNGLLPAIRFHQEDPFLASDLLLNDAELMRNRAENDGFLSLDYVFEKNFKQQLAKRDPSFYELVKSLSLEDFVDIVMSMREQQDPFALFQAEYMQAEQSIRKQKSIYWKEVLSALSFSLNYPAKYLSAEDMLRLQKVLMPLISVVIAFIPQSSCKELLALYAAGRLEIIGVGADSAVKPQVKGGATYTYTDEDGCQKSVRYRTFIDCVGQAHLPYSDFPFHSLRNSGAICPAHIRFRSPESAMKVLDEGNKHVAMAPDGSYYLQVPGITINDHFQVVSNKGVVNDRIYIMAVPYIGGYNPDYSGLDFCKEASDIIALRLLRTDSAPAGTLPEGSSDATLRSDSAS